MHYNHNFKINIEEIHQIKFTIPQKFFFFFNWAQLYQYVFKYYSL